MCRDLDLTLFEDDHWFAIDAKNRRVSGVVIPDLDTGLRLLGHTRVATIVGRLRPALRVVDVDVPDVEGHALTEHIASWCATRRLWHLVRPSGGADGRTHIFIAPTKHGHALEDFLADLRDTWRLPRSAVDLRTTVRPLSAPHRTGPCQAPLGPLSQHLTDLRRTLARHAVAAPKTEPRPASQPQAPRTDVPLIPRPRTRRDLPVEWETYLRTGQPPAVGGSDHSRSTYEAICTGHLLRAGFTFDEAWDTIQGSHPDSMPRARASRTRWISLWNRAVKDDNSFFADRPPPTDPAVAAAVAEGRARLAEWAWSVAPRRRYAVLLIGHNLLDRIQRGNRLRVPCPERDLLQDSGIRDRKTIRETLRELDRHVGTLHRCFDPARRSASSYEFSIEPGAGQVREIPPPSPHTPSLPVGTWAALPRQAHQIWRALHYSSAPLPTEDLPHSAHLTPTKSATPTASHHRTTRSTLLTLARAGLAECHPDGTWSTCTEFSDQHTHLAAQAYGELQQHVEEERAEYRSRRGSTSWSVQRAAALKAQRAKERAWWRGLDPTERQHRSDQYAQQFAELSVQDQHERKAEWADRRVRLGEDEHRRHQRWLANQLPQQRTARSLERSTAFQQLPGPIQVALARAWDEHRKQYRLDRGPTGQLAESQLIPDTRDQRDEAFLYREADHRDPTLPLGLLA